MSDPSDSDDDRSNSEDGRSDNEVLDVNYLNAKLKYKVSDPNGVEKPLPYFKSNQHKSVPIVGQSKPSKKKIYNIMHTLNEMTELIEVTSYPTLLHFGMGLATVNTTVLPSDEASLFVLSAARDCVIRATDVLRQIGIAPKNPNIKFRGDVIAAGMIEYWQKGEECRGYHELFFNGLFLVLYGGLGDTAEGITESVKNYYDYHFGRAYIVEGKKTERFETLDIELGYFDEISYAFFPNKRAAEGSTPKSAKKQKCNRHEK